jgi:hypothetical protein
MLSKYLDFLKREDIKQEVKKIIHPIGDIILEEIKPCLLYLALFVFIHFILIVCIFIYVLRIKYFLRIVYEIKHA